MQQSLSDPVLVTGASGFIGANLIKKLILENHAVHVLLKNKSNLWRIEKNLPDISVHIVDITDRESVFTAIKKIKPKTIFHLATYGAYPFQEDTLQIENTNVHGLMNLLDACIKYDFDVFINTGSSSEYGFKNTIMRETDLLEPNSAYATFKAAGTHYCQYMASSHRLPIITLRLFSVYGPLEASTRLIPTLLSQLPMNQCPPLVSPDTARDFIFIDDAVEAYFTAGSKPHLGGNIFNIASGNQTTLDEIVNLSIQLTNSTVVPVWKTMEARTWDQNVWHADISKAKSMLEWSPKNGLKTGLLKTIAWRKINSQV